MRKIVLFEKLTIFSLILSIPLKFILEKIYYRDISENLKKNWIENFLTNIGIVNLGFNDIECLCYLNSFEIRKKLELNFTKKYLEKNDLYTFFLNKYDANEEKFKLCLRGELEGMGDPFESQSISLLEKYKLLDNKTVYYFPISYTSYLLSKDYHNSLKLIPIFFLVNFILNIFSKIFSMLIKRLKIKQLKNNLIKNLNNKSINLKDYKIAFFPHQGLKYGKSYSKIFYYNSDKNSKLNKKNVLNIIRDDSYKPELLLFTKRFFSFWNMPNIYMKDYKLENNLSRIILFFKKLKIKKVLNLYELILFFFMSKSIIKIEKNLLFFDNLPNLKTIICDYDILFEKTILLACDIKKIKTVAIQDRYAVNTLLSPLFFNHYFIVGEKFEPFFKDYGYIVDKYYPIGMSRSSHFINKKKLIIKNEYIRLNKIEKKKVLFLGLKVDNKFITRLNGEIGTSLKNNIFFFEELIKISKNFKDFYFILRLKSYKNFNLLPKKILSEIHDLKNVEIDYSDKLNIYELLSICDLVVGRQSSIIEESLSDNIPSIILDEDNLFSNYKSYPLNKIIITIKNSQQLNMYFDRFYEGKSLYSPEMKNKINKYLLPNKKDLNFKSKLQNILEEIV